jgi:hypothetical protein
MTEEGLPNVASDILGAAKVAASLHFAVRPMGGMGSVPGPLTEWTDDCEAEVEGGDDAEDMPVFL